MAQVFLQTGVISSLSLASDIIENPVPEGTYLARVKLITDVPAMFATLAAHSPHSPPIVSEWHATPAHSEYLKEFIWGAGPDATLRFQSFSSEPACTLFYEFTLFSLP